MARTATTTVRRLVLVTRHPPCSACPESAADASFRAELLGASPHTMMTRAVSGRPARCIGNAFAIAAEEAARSNDVPDYPIAYDAAKAVMAAARGAGEPGYAVRFAGQGAPLARALPAARLVSPLCEELEAARRGGGGRSKELSTRKCHGSS